MNYRSGASKITWSPIR